jgi:hypothetical protein
VRIISKETLSANGGGVFSLATRTIAARCRTKQPDLSEVIIKALDQERTVSKHTITLGFIEMH